MGPSRPKLACHEVRRSSTVMLNIRVDGDPPARLNARALVLGWETIRRCLAQFCSSRARTLVAQWTRRRFPCRVGRACGWMRSASVADSPTRCHVAVRSRLSLWIRTEHNLPTRINRTFASFTRTNVLSLHMAFFAPPTFALDPRHKTASLPRSLRLAYACPALARNPMRRV
jgi:hypothetical protein